mmetsp:Transcript_12623/g.18002  ORF Transcript_12623/g.18002 Transcript_12623/m.18002 type:complete len:168 (+) Transcript_12623:357-860(+)
MQGRLRARRIWSIHPRSEDFDYMGPKSGKTCSYHQFQAPLTLCLRSRDRRDIEVQVLRTEAKYMMCKQHSYRKLKRSKSLDWNYKRSVLVSFMKAGEGSTILYDIIVNTSIQCIKELIKTLIELTLSNGQIEVDFDMKKLVFTCDEFLEVLNNFCWLACDIINKVGV